MNRTEEQKKRAAGLWKAGWAGICVNGLLALVKLSVGLFSNSLAVMSEALNNLNDCLSSLISVLLSKYVDRSADESHPYGYGRAEYIAAFTISLLILLAGGNLVIESVKRIFKPEQPAFSLTGIAVLIASAFAKSGMSMYQIRMGRKLKSDALKGAGMEARVDVLQSAGTILCALILRATGLNLDAYAGGIIALLMLVTGFQILKGAFDSLLGEKTDPVLSEQIRTEILSRQEILDVFHIRLHTYGPLNQEGEAVVTMPGNLTVCEASALIDRMRIEIQKKFGIRFRFEIRSESIPDETGWAIFALAEEAAMKLPGTRSVHGFTFDPERNEAHFSVLTDYSVKNDRSYRKTISEAIRKEFPTVAVLIDLERG